MTVFSLSLHYDRHQRFRNIPPSEFRSSVYTTEDTDSTDKLRSETPSTPGGKCIRRPSELSRTESSSTLRSIFLSPPLDTPGVVRRPGAHEGSVFLLGVARSEVYTNSCILTGLWTWVLFRGNKDQRGNEG